MYLDELFFKLDQEGLLEAAEAVKFDGPIQELMGDNREYRLAYLAPLVVEFWDILEEVRGDFDIEVS